MSTKRTSKSKDALEAEWFKGYVCAVAKLVIMHGSDVEARDLLREAGRIPWDEIDPYDKEIISAANLATTTPTE